MGTFHPGLKILAGFQKPGYDFSAWTNGLKAPQNVHVIEMEFQPGLKRQFEHAQ